MRRKYTVSLFVMLATGLLSSSVYAIEAHKELEGKEFNTPQDVTKACLECHAESATELMTTSHWTLEEEQIVNGRKQLYGKKNAMTNFAITIQGNWERCTECHIGYGWQDKKFDLTNKNNIDCLICHDTTGTYKKARGGAGMPKGYSTTTGERSKQGRKIKKVDLQKVARNVGMPTKKNCGSCHFGGCGEARVRHGDLDPSFAGPDYDTDIHMAADGENFNCQECHYPQEKHNIKGHYMVPSIEGTYQSGCVECHSDKPHELNVLNSHYEAIACQTCHIPSYARKYAAKTEWNWAKGQGDTKAVPSSIGGRQIKAVKSMGTFSWGKDLMPIYEWYDGSLNAYMMGDKVNPDDVIKLNQPKGSLVDSHSKIFPFKTHHGHQLYDKKYNYLISPRISEKGETAFWKTYDWDKAAEQGMEAIGLPYSGEFGFVDTVMFWRLNHGVVPGDKALGCLDCHGKHGRLPWGKLGYKGDPWKVKGLYRCSPEFEADDSLIKAIVPKE